MHRFLTPHWSQGLALPLGLHLRADYSTFRWLLGLYPESKSIQQVKGTSYFG